MNRARVTASIPWLSLAALLSAGGCGDSLECGAGTRDSGGKCIPSDELLAKAANLTEAAEPNGPGEANVAGSFDAPALGGSTTFYGCITPTTDADGDGNLDTDYDNWEVTASGPMVLEITTDGIRGLSAGFVVQTADPALLPTLQNWQRFGINRTGDTSRRELFLPAAGTYSLLVTDVRSLFGGGGAGSADTCYFGTVKRVATPSPVALTVPSTSGQDQGRVQLYEFAASGTGDIIDVTANAAGEPFRPAFVTLMNGVLHGSAAAVPSAFGTTPPVSTIGGLDVGDLVTIVADAEYDYALEPQDFTLDSFHIQAQALPTSGAVLTVTEMNGSSGAGYPDLNYLYLDVASAGIKRFDLVASKPVDMVILRDDLFTATGALDYVASINALGGAGQATFQGEFVRFLTPGRYYFVAQNPAAITAGGTYTITSTITDVATTPLTLGTAADLQPLPLGSAFHSLDLTDPIWLEFGVTATSNWGAGGNVSIESYDLAAGGWLRSGTPPASVPAGNLFPAFTGSQPSVAPFAPMGRILANDTRDFLLRVKPTAATNPDPTYSLLVRDRPDVVNLGTIAPGTPVNRLIPALANATPTRFIAFGANGNTLRSLAHPLGAVDLREVRLNVSEGAIASFNATGVAGDETLTGITGAAPNDWIAWTVENLTPAVPSDVDLTVTTVAPRPYTITSGAIPFVDACVGGTTLGTGLDDELFTAQTLPASFSVFQLFGEPVPATFRVGANGWISWDTGTVSWGAYQNQRIPAAAAPNGVIAPFWQDLDTLTLCRKDDAIADTVTFQWTGKLYQLAPLVQFQAILHSNGVIDFVYGPTHAATGATPDGDGNGATVGAENLSGTFGHEVVFNQALVTANGSWTLTPQ